MGVDSDLVIFNFLIKVSDDSDYILVVGRPGW